MRFSFITILKLFKTVLILFWAIFRIFTLYLNVRFKLILMKRQFRKILLKQNMPKNVVLELENIYVEKLKATVDFKSFISEAKRRRSGGEVLDNPS